MVRFIHTGDLQLGMKSNDISGRGEQLREARFAALGSIVRLAMEEAVDFVVIAGDMFEHNQVATRTVSRAVQLLQEAAPIPVFILPGNHDWYDAGSVYRRREFTDAQDGNIIVLSEAEPVEFAEDCVLYPCPVTERWCHLDPTVWIPAREDAAQIRIGVAHGTLPVPGEQRILPIEPETAQRAGLDYLALGHTHGTRRYESDRVAYCGTPEQTSFGEEGAGQVLLVSIEQGRPPRIEERRTGSLTWLAWERTIGGLPAEELASLRDEVQALEDGPRTLLRLRLGGTIAADGLPLVRESEQWLQARCENGQLLYADLQSELRTTEELEGALRVVAGQDSVIAGAIADLQSLATPEEAAPEAVWGVAPRAREELAQIWRQTGPPEGEDLASAEVAQEAMSILAEIAGEVE